MDRIEYAELKRNGASKKALDCYSNTDPLNITESNGIFKITGCFENEFSSIEEVIEWLENLADEFSC